MSPIRDICRAFWGVGGGAFGPGSGGGGGGRVGGMGGGG